MKHEAREENIKRVLKTLGGRYHGQGDTHLGTPEDTLLATLLSARTTDKQTLAAFPAFRKRFPTWKKLADADWTEIAETINTIGLYRQKAKAINKLARMILDEYDGRVPSTMEDLTRLPGVGRKTASVVLSFVFGTPAIAVDTHVFRITHRLGWVKGKDAKRVERELMELVPKRLWSEINRVLVPFGRDICRAPTPQCWRCPVAQWCAYPNKTEKPKA
ncbi:MAG: endonuclease III [Candidatus Uhrbacteria bacterium]|nr:endonuclease III [Candidatus Uhrbacteria bacterium]